MFRKSSVHFVNQRTHELGHYEESTLWIGRDYKNESNFLRKVLIIGHSTYDTQPNDPPGIISWIEGNDDKTFSKLLEHVQKTPICGIQTPRDLFRSIAFYNFVPDSLGPENRDPTPDEYEQGKKALPGVISHANPRAIFVFGLNHREHSSPLLEASGIAFMHSVHLVWDTQGRFLPMWKEFVEKLNDIP